MEGASASAVTQVLEHLPSHVPEMTQLSLVKNEF
jgi:hypothetical protein